MTIDSVALVSDSGNSRVPSSNINVAQTTHVTRAISVKVTKVRGLAPYRANARRKTREDHRGDRLAGDPAIGFDPFVHRAIEHRGAHQAVEEQAH